MKLRIRLILVFLAAGLTGARLPDPVQGKTQVYLLLGQSNMAGRGKITAEYQELQHPRVLMFTKDQQWTIARHPLHFDKPKAAGVGPGLSFGMAMAAAYPADTIALVPCAVGGTAIAKWEPGVYDNATGTHPYDDALVRIKAAMAKGPIEGVIWLQGEADSGKDALVASYLEKLEALISTIRRETRNKQLPWVAGELGPYRGRYLVFNKELNKLPRLVKYTAVVSSADLKHKGDTTHLDSHSATVYGERFAAAMIGMQRQPVRK